MEPFLSVIIPVYNVSGHIDKMISSIVNQTYKNLEILIINDGSTDDTYQKCLNWSEIDDRVKVFNQNNSGQSTARNLGIRKSRGEFVYFADGDDYLDSEYFEYALTSVGDEVDLIISNYAIESPKGIEYFKNDHVKFNRLDMSELTDQILLPNTSISGFLWNKFFKKEILTQTKSFDENIFYSEDTLFLLRYLKKCNQAMTISSPAYYHYVIRSGSTTISKFSNRKTSVITANKKMLNEVDSVNTKKIIQARLIQMYLILIINIIDSKNPIDIEIENELVKDVKFNYQKYILNSFASKKNKLAISLIKVSYPIFKVLILLFHSKKFKMGGN